MHLTMLNFFENISKSFLENISNSKEKILSVGSHFKPQIRAPRPMLGYCSYTLSMVLKFFFLLRHGDPGSNIGVGFYT